MTRSVVRLLGVCVIAGLLVAGVAFPVVGGLGALSLASGSPVEASSPELAQGVFPALTTVTDRDGAPIAYLFDQDREPVPSAAISPAMKAAIAIEDRRFYDEAGVDPQGIIRAALNNSSGGSTQGASSST